jgi:flavin-dependent dehydrogenase
MCAASPLAGPAQGFYDVVIAGGGLAGLSLALQLARAHPELRLCVAERTPHPLPEARHKVGESSVEIASHYFRTVLGLEEELASELPKFGLRFFFSHGDNTDITKRLECGPSHFLSVPSFHIDRGRFENALARRCAAAGVEFIDDCRVSDLVLGDARDPHEIVLSRGGERRAVRCRWVVDASGRASLLKKRLDLARPNRHDVNAVWFRLDHPVDLDDWAEGAGWRRRVRERRRLSTNHLMGRGYWVWFIPLVHSRTSVGIVADARLHPFSTLHTFDKAIAWLEQHEPQCAAVIRQHRRTQMDFLVLKDYSHDAKQLFSADRWCITGEAGAFVDPLYSPGSDFIGISNSFICDLIGHELRGEDISGLSRRHDKAYRALCRTFLATYDQQYPMMGNGRVMILKILWDFAMYWGGIALLFHHDKLCDRAFMTSAESTLSGFAFTNITMQAFFRRWAARDVHDATPPEGFLDYAGIDFLTTMNRNLQRRLDDAALLALLRHNFDIAKQLQREIVAFGTSSTDRACSSRAPVAPRYLRDVFSVLQPESAPRRISA